MLPRDRSSTFKPLRQSRVEASTPNAPPEPRRASFPWRLLIVAHRVARSLETISITRQFAEYIPTVGPSDGILETATSSVPETFTQSDSAWLFNIIPLGTTVSEIRVPAIYRYHIQLRDPWKLVIRGQVCVVLAPQFQPSLPPAIDTAQMEKSVSDGWLRFDTDDDLTSLEKGITAELDKRASDKLHRDFVREACRHSVADFVKTWLMKEDYWRDDRFHQIVVLFPDEVPANVSGPPSDPAKPSITFENGPDSGH
jgi:hypothetical protein